MPVPAPPLVDLDAERAVLGCLLNDPACLGEVASILTPEHFYQESHALIYRTILQMARNGGYDTISLAGELERAGVLEAVGGRVELLRYSELAIAAQAPHHARSTRQLSDHRHMVSVGKRLSERAADPVADLRDVAREMVAALPQAETGDGLVVPCGLGYEGRFGPWRLTLTRLRESRGELSGELQVCWAVAPAWGSPCLVVTRLSLVSVGARTGLAKHLDGLARGDWTEILNTFALRVLERERAQKETTWIGTADEQPVEYLLEPLLQAGQPTLLFGPGGSGKSTLAGAIVLALETGEVVVPGWKPTLAPTLILDWETTPSAWNRIIRALARGVDIEAPAVRYLRCARPLADIVEEVAAAADEVGAECLVIDSVGHALGSSGEGSDANETAIRMFRALRLLGRTSLLIDHVKGDDVRASGSVAKAYGSVYKSNAARSVWELRREREPFQGRAEVLLVHNKVNEGALQRSIGLTYEYDDGEIYGGPTIAVKRADVQAPELVGALSVADRMWHLLAAGALDTGTIAKEVSTTAATIRSIVKRDGGRRFVRLEWNGKPMVGRARV